MIKKKKKNLKIDHHLLLPPTSKPLQTTPTKVNRSAWIISRCTRPYIVASYSDP